MPRYKSKTDSNQQEIIDALRKIGASVKSLHAVGDDIPDLLIGYIGKNYLLEVKTLTGVLSPGQKEFHGVVKSSKEWKGQKIIVRTIEEAFIAIGAKRKPGT